MKIDFYECHHEATKFIGAYPEIEKNNTNLIQLMLISALLHINDKLEDIEQSLDCIYDKLD